MTSPTDLAERLRGYADQQVLQGNGIFSDALREAARKLDRLSALESAASQRDKNVAYVAFCIGAALDNGDLDDAQRAMLENWRDYLEGRANAPGPGETWSDVAQPASHSSTEKHDVESAASGAVTDEELRISVGLILGEVYLMGAVAGSSKEPTSDNGEEHAARIHALYAPRLAKAEQRCKELEDEIFEWKRTVEALERVIADPKMRARFDALSGALSCGRSHTHDAPSSEPAPSDGATIEKPDFRKARGCLRLDEAPEVLIRRSRDGDSASEGNVVRRDELCAKCGLRRDREIQVSQGMRELASAIEREGDIPVSQSDLPDFYIYGHQSGEPVIASQDRREREYAQRMARDDAKKGKVSDGPVDLP